MSMPISLNNVSLEWPNGSPCFSDLNAIFSSHLTGLIGDNGSGKTSLIRVILGELQPSTGSVERPSKIAYLPQDLGLQLDTTISDVFGITEIIEAISAIEGGQFNPELFELIGDRWDAAEETRAVLSAHGLELNLDRPLFTLSGGEAVRVALAALMADNPDFIVMDEPTNNLDAEAKAQLIRALSKSTVPAIVVSHDRDLLDSVDEIAELHDGKLRLFPGNYSAYREALANEQDAAMREVREKKTIHSRQVREREAMQTRIARDARRGRKFAANNRKPGMAMGLDKDRSEKTAARRGAAHAESVESSLAEYRHAQDKVRDDQQVYICLLYTSPSPRDS